MGVHPRLGRCVMSCVNGRKVIPRRCAVHKVDWIANANRARVDNAAVQQNVVRKSLKSYRNWVVIATTRGRVLAGQLVRSIDLIYRQGGVWNWLRKHVITRTSETGVGSELDKSDFAITHPGETRTESVRALHRGPRG